MSGTEVTTDTATKVEVNQKAKPKLEAATVTPASAETKEEAQRGVWAGIKRGFQETTSDVKEWTGEKVESAKKSISETAQGIEELTKTNGERAIESQQKELGFQKKELELLKKQHAKQIADLQKQAEEAKKTAAAPATPTTTATPTPARAARG